MNIIRPIAAPGRPAAATLGLVDCDIHPRCADLGEYRPFIINHGGLVVFAAGNEGRDQPSSVASCRCAARMWWR